MANYVVCDHCGTTDKKTAETVIDKLIVKVQNNGEDNGSYTETTEACQSCRKQLMAAIKDLLTSKVADIQATMKKG